VSQERLKGRMGPEATQPAWEGDARPSTLRKLSEALEVDPAELLE
jgi:hypothetical protein